MTQMQSEKKTRQLELQGPFILFRTKRGLSILERLGKIRFMRVLGWVALIVFPIVGAIGLFILLNTVAIFIANSQTREFARSAGPLANILIPGLNPFLPVVYGWLAIVIALIVHEGSHGVLARALGFPVKSSGLLFLGPLPIGAFVEVDDKELKKASSRNAGRVLAAGPGGNVLIGVIALIGLIAVVGSMTPVSTGVGVVGILENFPANQAGIAPGDVIFQVNGLTVINPSDLTKTFSALKPGDAVTVSWFHSGERLTKQLVLAESPSDPKIGIIGINGVDPGRILNNYRQLGSTSPFIYMVIPTIAQSTVPFSDTMQFFYTSPLGLLTNPVANFLFWVWFINFNLAIFNALPIYPLDGGQAFSSWLRNIGKNRLTEKGVSWIAGATTLGIVFLVALMFILPSIP